MKHYKHTLKRQKPKRRPSEHKYSLIASLRKTLTKAIGVTIAIFALYALYIRYEQPVYSHLQSVLPKSQHSSNPFHSNLPFTESPHLSPPTKYLHRKFQISVQKQDESPPDEHTIHKIINTAASRLYTGHRDELQLLSEYLLQESRFDRVTITRKTPGHVLITVSVPVAIAVIQVDVLRYFSENGQIFGSADQKDLQVLPQISGVFSTNSRLPYTIGINNKLMLPAKYQPTLQTIRKALLLAQSHNLELITLHYNPYRGINIRLKNHTLITLGHPPFTQKLKRLRSIFENTDSTAEHIVRIELDYKGKAFIQKTEKQTTENPQKTSSSIPTTQTIRGRY